MKTFAVLEAISRDLLHALRTMRKNPVFTATAVLTLALAIGGNTAMFTVIRAVLLNPLHYPDPDRLVRLSGGATPTRFAEMKSGARSFAELGVYTRPESITLSGKPEPKVLTGVRVSANFLRILRVSPLLGRSFRSEEDLSDAPVAMISAELWQERFGGDRQIIGRTAVFASTPCTIVGVLPPRFQFPSPEIDVWMTAPSDLPSFPAKSRALSPFLAIFGRLKPLLTLNEANAEMRVIRRQYAAAHPTMLDAKPKTTMEVTAMKDELVAQVRAALWLLFGAVGFVLIIACANVANLLLTRAASRAREFALRAALGAARRRLIGQLLAESILLSVLGGVFGMLMATLVIRNIPKITAWKLPRVTEIHMDWVVFFFAMALSVATGILFGLAPSLGASRPDLMNMLRGSGALAYRGTSRRIPAGFRVRNLLSVGQVALSVILLIGAALLIESITNLRGVELGFNSADLLTMSISLPPLRYDTDRKKGFFFDDLAQRTRLLPGVRNAAVAMSLPMMDYAGIPVQDAAKPKLKLNERPIVKIFPVTPGYFRALEIPLKRGRDFTERDMPDAQRVAIVDENLARRFWPAYPAGQNLLGQKLLIGGINPKPAEIVGIVGNARQNLDDSTNWQESVYVPLFQDPPSGAMLVLRTMKDQPSLTRAVREQVRTLDWDQPIGNVRTMEDRVEAQLGQRRLLVLLLGSFASLALALALIGIYGTIAFSVVQRVQEVGVRRALGAQGSDILRLFIGQGVILASVGIIIGLAGAMALTRVMTSLLFHISPTDPLTFVCAALLFFVVAVTASYIPTCRAIRIDPMTALRI